MTRELIGFLMVASVLIIALIVGVSYSVKRRVESREIEPPMESTNCEGLECLYVSTVHADNPLRRLLAHGMGPRGKAEVSVSPDGVSICRKGERNFLIPKSQILGLEKSTATIDRAVEPGGLASILWVHSGLQLATNLRFQSRADREKFEKEVAA